MKRKVLQLLLVFFMMALPFQAAFSQTDSQNEARVIIYTEYGDMIVKLYNETPLHRDNFIKLVENQFYDSLLFHRVIKDFMIQGGDPESRNAPDGAMLGTGGLDYLIDAEILPQYYHKKGALAAARQADAVNPQKKSSACQFYIVQGKPSAPSILKSLEARKASMPGGAPFKYSEAAIADYEISGGAPHLDGEYTVFGEVIAGLDVIDRIAALQVDGRSRPVKNVRMRIELVK